jgi:hypothetical protein
MARSKILYELGLDGRILFSPFYPPDNVPSVQTSDGAVVVTDPESCWARTNLELEKGCTGLPLPGAAVPQYSVGIKEKKIHFWNGRKKILAVAIHQHHSTCSRSSFCRYLHGWKSWTLLCLREHPCIASPYSCAHVGCNRVSPWRHAHKLIDPPRIRTDPSTCNADEPDWSTCDNTFRERLPPVSCARSSSFLTWTVSSCNLQVVCASATATRRVKVPWRGRLRLGLIRSPQVLYLRAGMTGKTEVAELATQESIATVLGQRSTWLAHDYTLGSSWMFDQAVRYRREHRVISRDQTKGDRLNISVHNSVLWSHVVCRVWTLRCKKTHGI